MISFLKPATPPPDGVPSREWDRLSRATYESALEESIRLDKLARTRLRILDSVREGVYQINSHGLCTFMNRAACHMLGYKFGEGLGLVISDQQRGWQDGPSAAILEHPIHGALAEPDVSEIFEDDLRCKDGSKLPVECSVHPLFERGVRLGTVVTFHSAMERKRMERRLKLQHGMTALLDGKASIEETVHQLLRTVGESLDFCWGGLWRVDADAGVLRLSNVWSRSPSDFENFEALCRNLTWARGQGFIGEAWMSAQPVCASELLNDDADHLGAASRAGLRSGIAVPIHLPEADFGVISFLSSEHAPIDLDLLQLLGDVAREAGQVIESKRNKNVRATLAAILDTGTDFVGIVVSESGIILSISGASETIFGFTPSEAVGQSLTLLIPEYRRHFVDNGWPDDLSLGSFPNGSARMRGRRRSGDLVPLEVSLGEHLEGGSRVVAGIIRDITDQTNSEEKLERQAENLRNSEDALRQQTRLVNSIVNSMGKGVIAADENGEILLFNPAASELLGTDLTSILGQRMAADVGSLTAPTDQAAPYLLDRSPLGRALRGERVDGLEVFVKTAQRPQGFWLNETARPMIDDDGLLRGGVLVLRDVTEQKASRENLRKAKDEAEAANRAKSEFLSRMSHELRTPMNAILGFAQLLENEDLTPDQSDAMARILRAGRHLLGLINEVLDLSKIEAGRIDLQLERLQASEVMQAAMDMVSQLAARSDIDLTPLLAADACWIIHTDRQRLMQVFVNLLGNAIKYNRARGRVTVLFEERQDGQLRIKVSDTGLGIPPEQVKKLFVPFERLGAERTGVEGTGLGLAHSDRLIRAMGGSIGVDSRLGEGSTFWVDIALAGKDTMSLESSSAPLVNRTETETNTAEIGLGKILCIQNDAPSFEAIEQVFARIPGFGLVSAERGALGLQLAREERPELVLLDLNLPDMDGVEVLRALRSEAITRRIPVVIVSAGLTDSMKQEAVDLGAHSCIDKPIQVRSFLDTVACLLLG